MNPSGESSENMKLLSEGMSYLSNNLESLNLNLSFTNLEENLYENLSFLGKGLKKLKRLKNLKLDLAEN